MGSLILIIYLVGLFVRPQDWWAPMLGFPFDDVFCSLGLIFALFSRGMQKRSVQAPQNIFIVFFLVVVFLSNVANGDFPMAVQSFIYYLKRTAVFVMFLFLVDSPRQLKWMAWTSVFCVTFLATQAITMHITGVNVAGRGLMSGRSNWAGMWDGPNVLSLIMAMSTAFPLHQFLKGRFLSWIIHLPITTTLVYAFYQTDSRGGFLALLTTFFMTTLLKIRPKRRLIIAGILGGMFILLLGSPLAPSRTKDLTTKESSNRERIWVWEQGLDLIEQKPILGVGKGRFEDFSYLRLKAHNNYIQIGAEMGMIGLFIYISIMYLCFKSLVIARDALLKQKKEEDLALADLIRPLQVSLAAFCVMTMFVTMTLDIMFLWWGFCAVAYTLARKSVGDLPVPYTFKDIRWVGCIMIFTLAFVWLIAVKEIV